MGAVRSRRVPRRVAVLGLGLVAVMQLIFALTGSDRPASYVPIQLASAGASLAAAYGLARLDRGGGPWMTIGFAINLVTRILQIVLGLSKLALWINVALIAAFGLAMGYAATWANGRGRPGKLRVALVVLAIVHFIAMLDALSRLNAAIGLALGTAGFSMAAAFGETDT
jgi:hypothetical protein